MYGVKLYIILHIQYSIVFFFVNVFMFFNPYRIVIKILLKLLFIVTKEVEIMGTHLVFSSKQCYKTAVEKSFT